MELELDSRIKAGKRPLTCFDTEQAMQFIGKQCYFSDDATDFMDLDKADGDSMFYIAELQNVWTAEEYCFADNSNDWRYILPVEFVNGQETESESEPAQVICFGAVRYWRNLYHQTNDELAILKNAIDEFSRQYLEAENA